MFNYVGLVNTRSAIVVAQLSFGIPFAVWFLTDFFRQLPVEIEEAAMIDGDTRLEAIAFALVPNIKNGVFAAGILIFIYSWNNFLFPLLLASGEAVRTLPVEINNYDMFEGLLISRMSAAIIVIIVPVLLLAFVAQRYLVDPIAAGSERRAAPALTLDARRRAHRQRRRVDLVALGGDDADVLRLDGFDVEPNSFLLHPRRRSVALRGFARSIDQNVGVSERRIGRCLDPVGRREPEAGSVAGRDRLALRGMSDRRRATAYTGGRRGFAGHYTDLPVRVRSP